jgi:vitamin B12 transporter
VEAKRPDWESKLSPGTVTVIRPDDYKGEQKDLADFLKMVPGVHVREINGKGQYTTVSVRGSTAAQVGIFVDGILFNLGGDSAADISTIPVRNVERIEVYRGYIPARFGGTYMGGVINIVTKRPVKANVSASMGKKSYGGYSGGVEVDAPLGNGALLIGVNRDQSKGNFKYRNFHNDEQRADLEEHRDHYQRVIDDFSTNSIKEAASYGWITADQEASFLKSPNTWDDYVLKPTDNGKSVMYNKWHDTYYNEFNQLGSYLDALSYIRIYYPEYWDPVKKAEFKANWKAGHREQYHELYAECQAQRQVDEFDPEKSGTISNAKNIVTNTQKRINPLKSAWRWRKYNDYKNTDVIAKWQNDHWTVKGTWKQVLRHLPQSTWYGKPEVYVDANVYELMNTGNNATRNRQNLIDQEALLAWRNQAGRLEWGWTFDYLKQMKRYNCENWREINALYPGSWAQPFSQWSRYTSWKKNIGIDGSYRLGKRNLFEFMMNASDEAMRVQGSGVTDGTYDYIENAGRYRTRYSQKLFNAQVQDTITLDDKETLWLTPSIRYNWARNHSNECTNAIEYYEKQHPGHAWEYAPITQTVSRATWQVALKKKLNERLSLRTTGGTYFRLLNLYEIAGDGGGIMPAPINKATGFRFPKPENGTQYDLSAIWDGPIWGAETGRIELTGFFRHAKNLIYLREGGLNYWCYDNKAEGITRGVELQTEQSWKKWDVSLSGTYLNMRDRFRIDGVSLASPWHVTRKQTRSWMPKWEGYGRITYRPGQTTAVFTQINYRGKMNLNNIPDEPYIQDSLTTTEIGAKYRFPSGVQLTVGCQDIFNRGPKLKEHDLVGGSADWDLTVPNNPDYPTQGRTWYASMRYDF